MKGFSYNTHIRRFLIVVAILLLSTAFGCRTKSEDTVTNRDINAVLEAHAANLMSIPGVAAVGVGQLSDGTPCIKIYVKQKTDDLLAGLPKNLEGHSVVVEESGEFKPMEGD
jgi:hypothetical protein